MIKLVINLERRTDRKEYFTEKNNLSEVKFITAVDGESEDLSMYPTREGWVDPFLNRTITKAEVACFLSHRKAWQYCLDKQESVIVMEDDAIINDTWDEEYYEHLSNYWDFVYLQRNENEPEKTVYIDNKLERPWYPYNMTAYVLSPKGSKKLLGTDIMKGIIPVDEYLPELIQSSKFIPVALQKDACNQASVDILASDIRRKNMMHVVTIGTDVSKMKKLYDSAAKHNIAVNNWGSGVDWKGTDMSGPGGGMKVNILKKHLHEFPDTDIILFTDAYDVFYADDLETIKERYESFNKKLVQKYLEKKNVFLSIPIEKKIFTMPILVDLNKKQTLLFSENFFYNNWNKNTEKFYLLEYILPNEDLDDVEIIKKNFDNIEDYDFKDIISKYDLKDYLIIIFFKYDKNLKILSKINLNSEKIIFNKLFNNIDLSGK